MDSSVTLPRIAALDAASRPADSDGRKVAESGKALPPAVEPGADPLRLDEAIRQIQLYLSDTSRQLHFEVDEASGRTIVRVVNPETGELIRQMPSDEVLKLAAAVGAHGGTVLNEVV